jgi:hypothetical protein
MVRALRVSGGYRRRGALQVDRGRRERPDRCRSRRRGHQAADCSPRGEGASGGFRSIVLYRRGKLAFFVFGFPKNRTANIKKDELKAFKKLAKETLALNDRQIASLTKTKALTEVTCDG